MGKESFITLIIGCVIGYAISQWTLTPNAKFAQEEAKKGNILVNSGWFFTNESEKAFKPATPQYLERDFEAGANYICDYLQLKTGEDFCHSIINWR